MLHAPTEFVPGQPLHARLYGRAGCQHCVEALATLNSLHEEFDFWVEKIDIDQDPAIREKLHEHVPVITLNGGNRVGGHITADRLRRAFRRAMQLEEEEPEEAENGSGLEAA
jgi:glutaredoxin